MLGPRASDTAPEKSKAGTLGGALRLLEELIRARRTLNRFGQSSARIWHASLTSPV